MLKKVFLIPARGANPSGLWYPWIRSSLEQAGFVVKILQMPDPERPKKSKWMEALALLIPEVGTDTFFIGHSVGCQATLRFLESLPPGKRVGGVVLVAGWVSVPNWNGRSREEQAVLNDWMNPPIVFTRIAGKSKKFTAIFSDNDEFVPKENWAVCEKELSAHVIVKHHFDHFEGKDLLQLPDVVDAILEMAK